MMRTLLRLQALDVGMDGVVLHTENVYEIGALRVRAQLSLRRSWSPHTVHLLMRMESFRFDRIRQNGLLQSVKIVTVIWLSRAQKTTTARDWRLHTFVWKVPIAISGFDVQWSDCRTI